MKIAEKRKVIEVLLVGASIGCISAAYHLESESWVAAAGARARERAQKTSPGPNSFTHWGIEAAYRLIETSATLRREWFGAK